MENFTLVVDRLEMLDGKLFIIINVILNNVKIGEGKIDNSEFYKTVVSLQGNLMNEHLAKIKANNTVGNL